VGGKALIPKMEHVAGGVNVVVKGPRFERNNVADMSWLIAAIEWTYVNGLVRVVLCSNRCVISRPSDETRREPPS
jgi:hypothetical protein